MRLDRFVLNSMLAVIFVGGFVFAVTPESSLGRGSIIAVATAFMILLVYNPS